MTHRERELLQRLHDAGVVLKINGCRLLYQAPAGSITPELLSAMNELKPDLVREYHERAGILEYDARLSRNGNEGRATEETLIPKPIMKRETP